MVELIGTAIIISILIIIATGLYLYATKFIATDKFRIVEKKKGTIMYYRCEVYRPIFGWTSFDASEYNGNIWVDNSWTYRKLRCEDNIEIYKKLKPIK